MLDRDHLSARVRSHQGECWQALDLYKQCIYGKKDTNKEKKINFVK
jgi:hypothetical protein